VLVQVTFSGVPGWLLVAYLVEMGGTDRDDGSVRGEGWTARLAAYKAKVGSIALGRVNVTIKGVRSDEAMAVLRKKAQRGGG
jgi:hypothetical protein